MRRSCRHRSWIDDYDFIFDETAASNKGKLDLFRRIWSTRRLDKTGLGQAMSCFWCYTDIAFGITDLDRPLAKTFQRVFVLTAWKDLGSGVSRDDARWMSHLFDKYTTPRPHTGEPLNGVICQAFEQLQRRGGVVAYTDAPPIGPASVKRFGT